MTERRSSRYWRGLVRNFELLGIAFATVILCLRSTSAALLGPGEYDMRGDYVGVLECADCAGVWTEVVLDDPGADRGWGRGTFAITERFTGGVHGGRTVTTRGSWSTIERVEGQWYTGTIELQADDKADALRYFYCDHGRSLRLLDANRNPILARDTIPARDTLERVIPPPRPEFGPILESENHAVIAARVGDRFDVALPAASPDATLTAWTMITPAPNSSIALETTSGSGVGLKGVFTIFVLKAEAAGSARIEFRSTQSPARTATFFFSVAP